MPNDSQIIYILTNPAMPGLIKIGMTNREAVEERMKELYSTGVPFPFRCHFAYKVSDARKAEDALHYAFGQNRINPNREFFTVEPDRVVAILKLIPGEEATLQVNQEIESELKPEDKNSAEKFQKTRRPNMNFRVLDIPIGSTLKFRDKPIEVKVISDRKVEFKGEELYLTTATTRILEQPDGTPLQPFPYWLYEGRSLYDIYEDFYDEEAA